MVRYPIFVFDVDRPKRSGMFESESEFWASHCCLACRSGHVDIMFDSDGRTLKVDEDSAYPQDIVDSGDQPDPDRLRGFLIRALAARGQTWPEDAPLGVLMDDSLWHWKSHDDFPFFRWAISAFQKRFSSKKRDHLQ